MGGASDSASGSTRTRDARPRRWPRLTARLLSRALEKLLVIDRFSSGFRESRQVLITVQQCPGVDGPAERYGGLEYRLTVWGLFYDRCGFCVYTEVPSGYRHLVTRGDQACATTFHTQLVHTTLRIDVLSNERIEPGTSFSLKPEYDKHPPQDITTMRFGVGLNFIFIYLMFNKPW